MYYNKTNKIWNIITIFREATDDLESHVFYRVSELTNLDFLNTKFLL